MRTNTFYGSENDNSFLGDIVRFIDNHSGLNQTYKDLFANRLTLKPSDEELKLASAPAVRTDGTYAYSDGGMGLGKLPASPVLPFDHKNLGSGIAWPTLAKLSDLAGNESFIGGTLIEHVDEFNDSKLEYGRATILSIGWNKKKGEHWFEIATDSDKAWNGVNTKEAGDPDLTVMPDGAIRYKCPFGPFYTILPKDYKGSLATTSSAAEPAKEPARDPLAILDELRRTCGDGEPPFLMTPDEIKGDLDGETRAHVDAALLERQQIRLIDELCIALKSDAIKAEFEKLKNQEARWFLMEAFGAALGIEQADRELIGKYMPRTSIADLLTANSAQLLAVDSDWRTEEHNGRMHTRCWAHNDKGALCMSLVKHTGAPHIFCQRWPHEGYCIAACLLPEDVSRRGVACHAPKGEYAIARTLSPKSTTAEDIVRVLAAMPRPEKSGGHGDPLSCILCGGICPGGPCRLDCPSRIAKEWIAVKDKLGKIKFGPQLRDKSLLDICREFDAIDLSECNRRLEAGEKFDAACDEAMEKRQALGEKIKERLGNLWPEFEKSHEELTANFPASSKLAEHALADVTAEAMKDVRSFFMFGALASRAPCDVPIDDCQTDFFGVAIRAMQRLMVLAKAFGIKACP